MDGPKSQISMFEDELEESILGRIAGDEIQEEEVDEQEEETEESE